MRVFASSPGNPSIRRTLLLALSAFLSQLVPCAALAAPGPDLAVSYVPPFLTPVYSSGTYRVTVANIGNKDAAGVQLTIQMPKTGTSPQVYIMGDLLPGYSAACVPGGAAGTLGGTRLVCNLGTIRRNNASSVTFAIRLPEKTGPLTFSSTATTTTASDNNPGNNTNVPLTAALDYYENTLTFDVNGEAAYVNQHCTGTSLTAFFECTKFPSSIASHPSVFHDDNTITIPAEPDYTGSWNLAGDQLTFTYTYIPSGQTEVEFSGRGVPGTGCFEGLSRFPDGLGGYSAYVSPYRVCP